MYGKARELVLETYRVSRMSPRNELFGLTIGANIAEGCGRTQGEFVHFLQVAFGSASEAEYHLLLARDLGYMDL